MDIKMFLEFPGVLITIGVVLLLISIIIIIIAYRKDKKESKPIDALKLSENEIIADNNVSNEKIAVNEDDLGKTKMFPRAEMNNSKNDDNLSIPKIDIKQVLADEIDNTDEIDDDSKVMDVFEEEFGDYDKKDPVKKTAPKVIEPSEDDVELL